MNSLGPGVAEIPVETSKRLDRKVLRGGNDGHTQVMVAMVVTMVVVVLMVTMMAMVVTVVVVVKMETMMVMVGITHK